MSGRLMTILTVGVGLAAVACSDQRQPLPTAPSYHTGITELSPCDFGHIRGLDTVYFTALADRQAVANLLLQMQSAGPFTPVRRDRAFDIMVRIEGAVIAGTAGPPDSGSVLVNHLILCMYDGANPADTGSFPATFPEDFKVALTSGSHGAFSVRGGPSEDDTLLVIARVSAFSGVAPATSSTWSAMLSGNPSPKRILLYGRPGTLSAQHYDWKVLPHNATFSPGVVVGLCIDDGSNATSMVNEQNVGALPFQAVTFLPTGCSNTALLESGWGRSLASVARLGAELFGPRPLWAASAMSPGGLGGSTGGIRSEFGPFNLAATGGVTLAFVQQPPATVKVGQQFPVKVKATSGGTTIAGVSVTLESFNNNGAKVVLGGTNPVVTDESGVATFTLTLNKPGAYRLRNTAATTVVGRPAITVAQATSVKFNVKPK